MVLAGLTTFVLDSARESFELLMSVGAGTGLIYLLRWFWWRVNAWSEIAAMASSFVVAIGFFVAGKLGAPVPSHISLLITVAVTTAIWITVTIFTAPTDRATLVRFYRLVRPAGRGWQSVQEEAGVGPSPDSLPQSMLGWMLGCAMVYAALFGAGSFLYGKIPQGIVWLVIFVASAGGLARLLPRMWAARSEA
jgi:solute:Na+ symporter, SSS family